MAGEQPTSAYSEVRRADRAVQDDAWIIAMLRSAPFAALATVSDGQPFINSNLFAFDEAANAIYMHTAALGRTRSNVEEDARCCLSVSQMGRLLPHETALGMSVEYASVVVFGRATVIDDAAERERALQCILDKYFSHLRPGVTTAGSPHRNSTSRPCTGSTSSSGAASENTRNRTSRSLLLRLGDRRTTRLTAVPSFSQPQT